MRASFYTVGDRSAASSRVRAYVVADELRRRGWTCAVTPVSGVRGRLRALAGSLRRSDVVVLQKLTPPRPLLRWLRLRARVLVWEVDDAVHLGYPGEDASVTAVRTDRIEALRGCVDLVTTTSRLLADELSPRSGRVLALPGPAPAQREQAVAKERVVLWTGSSSTATNLALLTADVPVLVAAGWRCVAVGAGPDAARAGWEAIAWSPAVELEWLARASVGVMPLVPDPWSDRKAGYKVLEYLASGVVPVVTSSPAAQTVLGSADAGVLVPEGAPWVHAVQEALDRREELLAEGRRRLDELSVQSWTTAWIAAVHGRL